MCKILRKMTAVFASMLMIFTNGITAFAADSSVSLDAQITAAEQEVVDAEENLQAIQAQYDLGMIGFVDWMLARGDLSESRVYDLNKAKDIYKKASEESFLEWADGEKNTLPAFRNNKVVCTGDEKDAISIKSTKKAIKYMYELNEYRRNDTNFVGSMACEDAYVDFQNLAYAQAEANRVAGISTAGRLDHISVNTTVECLAFGSTSPIVAWGREKSAFDSYKKQLGYETITSMDQLKAVEAAAKDKGTVIGHYTGMFYVAPNRMMLMGMGYCEYGSYGVTHCYGASPLYASTKNGYYTVAEFEAYLDEYCATIDLDVANKRLEDAKKHLEELLQQRYEKCPGHAYKFVSHTEGSCTVDDGDLYICTKCGKPDFRIAIAAPGHTLVNGVCQVCSMTAPTSLTYIYITYGGSKTSISPVLVEEGQEAQLSLSYKTATATAHNDEFLVEVDDTDILEYIPGSCDSGTIRTKKPGIATITVTSVANPSVSKKMKIDVTDVGGHDYSLAPIEPGSGVAVQTCSKCGRVNNFTVPTSVKSVSWQVSGVSGYTYVPKSYTVGDKIIVLPSFDPANTNLSAFDVISSDPTRVSVERPSSYPTKAYLHVEKPGDVTITIVNRYDASVKVEYVLDCAEVGGHTYGAEVVDTANNRITKSCTGCGHVDSTNLPSQINGFKVRTTFIANNNYVYIGAMLPQNVNQGRNTTIQVDFAPDYSTCIYDFTFESSDPSVCTVTKTDARSAGLTFLKPGEATITATSVYNSNVKYEQKLYVSEQNGHSFSQLPSEKCLIQAATCTSSASYYMVCSGCGFISTDRTYTSGAALGHELTCEFTWNSSSNVDYKLRCERENSIIETGKVSKLQEISREKASCIKPEAITYEATVTYNSKIFKDQHTESTSNYAEHAWDAGTIIEESNCIKRGTKQYECRVCHTTKDEELALGHHKFEDGYCEICGTKCTQDECTHSFVENASSDTLAQVASCTTSAIYYKICEYCEWISDETYSFGDPLGHAFLDGVCVQCGKSNFVEGWQETEAGLVYVMSDGSRLAGDWYKLETKWYYFNEDGIAQIGWQKLSGKWYYFAEDASMVTGWQQLGGKWYYFAGSGAMATGWQQLSGKWYYFAGSGAMTTGWQQLGGKWYYFAGSGAMATGWQQIGNKWYYLGTSGAMVTGWQQISGKWYYFETSGVMAASKWIDGIYYVKANGVMATNEWISGKYYVDANGKWVKGKTK